MKKRAKSESVTTILKHIRQVFDWSQKQLADELWVSPATIALWELGKRRPTGPSLKLISMYSSAANQIEQQKILRFKRRNFPCWLTILDIKNKKNYSSID